MIVLHTGTLYRHGLNRIFEFAKSAGFDGIELAINDFYDTRDAHYIKSLIDEYQLPVVAISAPKKNSPKKIKLALDLAATIKCPTVIVRTPEYTDFGFVKWFKSDFLRVQDYRGVRLAVENVPAGQGFLIPKYALGNIDELKRYKYLCLDTSHLVSRKIDLVRIYERMKSKLVHIHLANWANGEEHQPPEKGLLPLESFLTKLKRDGYQQPISIKVNAKFMSSDDPKKVMENLERSLKFVKEFYS